MTWAAGPGLEVVGGVRIARPAFAGFSVPAPVLISLMPIFVDRKVAVRPISNARPVGVGVGCIRRYCRADGLQGAAPSYGRRCFCRT